MHFFPAFPVFTAHATRHINVAINLALLRHRTSGHAEECGRAARNAAHVATTTMRTSSLRSQVQAAALSSATAATFAQITCNLFSVLRKATSVDASAILLARRKRHFVKATWP